MWNENSGKALDGVSTPPFELDSAQAVDKSWVCVLTPRRRNIAKTATYAVMHFCVAIVVAFALTRDVWIALSIGLVEPIVQTVAYAIHEYGWSRKGEEQKAQLATT
ncbi:MAG: DUF2061 domain-containing protein [Pseudomonadota bacterium]